jgi:hypothetical protein
MKSAIQQHRLSRHRGAIALAVCMMAGAAHAQQDAPSPAPDEGASNFHLGGYLRAWTSVNLQDPVETPGNDRGKLSMVRGALLLDADWKTGPLNWKAIGRADREYKTSYLRRLEEQTRSATPNGPGSHITDLYEHGELREFYVDFAPAERLKLRIGKQQVVWGETDFFRAMDVVHGFDYRWRSFLEREGDELRKPLIMVNAKLDVPEASGTLQLLLRPGLDRDRDIGNTYDLSGGRWALQPNKGVDLLAPGLLNYNYRHRDGDARDATGGVRWSGSAGPVGYSFAYLRTFNNDPVVNSAFAPFGEQPSGALADFIHPKVDLIGLTLNGYVPALDAVLSTEIVYTKDAAFNVGSHFFNGALPGFGGIRQKNVMQTMLRMDKSLDLNRLLGTSRPSFFSVQVFDKWIRSFKQADDLVELAGFGAAVKEHSTLLTAILGLNYNNDKINPLLAVGSDLSNGGGFVIPSVEFVAGDAWRLLIEADLFFHRATKHPGQVEQGSHLFGGFAHNNQLMLRLTRQF